MKYVVTWEEGGCVYSEIVEDCNNPAKAIYSLPISAEDVISVVRYGE